MFSRDEFEQAYELYRVRPTRANAKKLMLFVGQWMMTREFACAGPCLAISDVIFERQHLSFNLLLRFAFWWLRRQVAEDRPAWNDYFMCRWQLTKEEAAVKEIHRRAVHITATKPEAPPYESNWGMVAWSAAWMMNSQAEQDPEFAEALKKIQSQCSMCGAT